MKKRLLMGFALVTVATLLSLSYLLRDYPYLFLIITLTLVILWNAVFLMIVVQKKRLKIKQLEVKLKDKDRLIERKAALEERLFSEMPTGVIMFDERYDIVWANQKARDIFESPLENRNLEIMHKPLFDALKYEAFTNPMTLKIYEGKYDIYYQENEDALYFYDVTEREKIRHLFETHKTVLGVLHFDNFEDALSVLDVQERNEIQGKYLGALDDWAYDYGFHLVPITSAKAVVYMHKGNLDALINDKFSIIDTIAQISKENDLIVTLSGGFASATLPLSQLGDLAEETLDLALARGGDQVVINSQGEALQYFGGNTNTQEKRTRISSRINAHKLEDMFNHADKVFIMPHKHPDTDAIGASIGLLKMAQASNNEAYIVLNFNELDKTVKKIMQLMEYEYVTFLDNFISIEEAYQDSTKKSLLVIVDHHSKGQVLDERLLSKIPQKAIVDHHRKLSDFIEGAQLVYIEPYASSSTELVIEMVNMSHQEVEINPFEATVMLSGIIVDTNNFMYRTGTRTFEAAAILRKFGADTFKVKNILRESLKEIQIKSHLLTLAEVVKKRFTIVIVPDDIGAERTLLAKIADDLLEIDNTVAAFVIGKLGNNIIGISARSLEGFNVQVVMEKFGGGGHLNNAGAQVEGNDKDAIRSQLIDVLEHATQEEKPMKVILMKDVKGKGKQGEVIEVAAGYGNYLLTSKQAIEATSENMQILENEKEQAKEQAEKELEEMKILKQRIDHRGVKVYVKLAENGKFYGKINTKQIAEALKKQHDIEIDKRKIQLDQTITSLGTYNIEVRLHREVTATFELLVVEQ